MEFGNVYEVFEPGDLVKINNVRHIHDGRTGTIIGIQHTGPDTLIGFRRMEMIKFLSRTSID